MPLIVTYKFLFYVHSNVVHDIHEELNYIPFEDLPESLVNLTSAD